jgi:predicted metal-dependent hydrolase
MSTSNVVIHVAGFDVEVVRKDIKNLHLGVYPPLGRVRVAAPPAVDDEAVRLAVISRLPWIRRQRTKLRGQDRQTARKMVNGETHYIWGRKFRLRVVEDGGQRGRVTFKGNDRLELHVPHGADRDARERRLIEWYRGELKSAVPALVDAWARVLGLANPDWAVRRMKTKWGTCKADDNRIWLNLELAKKPPECLDYIVLHEMAHLVERHHNDRFVALLDGAMPQWRTRRDELNMAPLAHEDWTY